MSKRQRSPQEKKELSYKRDRRPPTENLPASGKDSPKKKVFATRAYRHKFTEALQNVDAETALEGDEPLLVEVLSVRRREVKKFSLSSLRDNIRNKWGKRARVELVNFFRKPYDSESHQKTFTGFLETQMRTDTVFAEELAFYIDDLFKLTSQRPKREYELPDDYKQWFKAYLADNPTIEARLREWSSRTVGTAKKKAQ
jgi:hypothetical protein